MRSVSTTHHVRPSVFLLGILILPSNGLSEERLIDVYGQLPAARALEVSPSGDRLAMIMRARDTEVVVVIDRQTKQRVSAHPLQDVLGGRLQFLNDDQLLISFDKAARQRGIPQRFNYSGTIIFNIDERRVWRMLGDLRLTAYEETGRIVGINRKQNTVLTPAFAGRAQNLGLYQVDLATGRSSRFAGGNNYTVDWFVNQSGQVVAREDYRHHNKSRSIYSYLTKKKVFSAVDPDGEILFSAVTADGKSLVFSNKTDDRTVGYLSLETGAVTEEVVAPAGSEIEYLATGDLGRNYLGARVTTMVPRTKWRDRVLANLEEQLAERFPTSAVTLTSYADDFDYVVYLVSGGEGANDYYLFDRANKSFNKISSQYPDVERIGQMTEFEYVARDKLNISSVLTWPTTTQSRKQLPAIVLPHGGPSSHDFFQFDAWSQMFARMGYLVFQPNYRGSTGSGLEFEEMGEREYGLAMQDDITDGVQALVNNGIVDPNRICIVGSSYGGYAALVGGYKTPDLYRCIVSVAGISDLRLMLRNDRVAGGNDDYYVNRYWANAVGHLSKDKKRLQATSPYNHAANFTAPVLLIHGDNDYVVDIKQSRRMAKALNRHKKDVELVELKGEDHWLSWNPTRRIAMTKISEFVLSNNPVEF